MSAKVRRIAPSPEALRAMRIQLARGIRNTADDMAELFVRQGFPFETADMLLALERVASDLDREAEEP